MDSNVGGSYKSWIWIRSDHRIRIGSGSSDRICGTLVDIQSQVGVLAKYQKVVGFLAKG